MGNGYLDHYYLLIMVRQHRCHSPYFNDDIDIELMVNECTVTCVANSRGAGSKRPSPQDFLGSIANRASNASFSETCPKKTQGYMLSL